MSRLKKALDSEDLLSAEQICSELRSLTGCSQQEIDRMLDIHMCKGGEKLPAIDFQMQHFRNLMKMNSIVLTAPQMRGGRENPQSYACGCGEGAG